MEVCMVGINLSNKIQRYNKHLTNLPFSIRTVSFETSFFFPAGFREKKKTRSVTYGKGLEFGEKSYIIINYAKLDAKV